MNCDKGTLDEVKAPQTQRFFMDKKTSAMSDDEIEIIKSKRIGSMILDEVDVLMHLIGEMSEDEFEEFRDMRAVKYPDELLFVGLPVFPGAPTYYGGNI